MRARASDPIILTSSLIRSQSKKGRCNNEPPATSESSFQLCMCQKLFLSLQPQPKWHESSDEISVQGEDDCQTLAVSNPQELGKNRSHILIPLLSMYIFYVTPCGKEGRGGRTRTWAIASSLYLNSESLMLSQTHSWSTELIQVWTSVLKCSKYQPPSKLTSAFIMVVMVLALIIFQKTQAGISSPSLATVLTCRKGMTVSHPFIFTTLLKKKKGEKPVFVAWP